MRKLATIRKINSVHSIENADNIEFVKIDGWQCVIKKGEFEPGDLCVYFQIDSFLPIDDRYSFLKDSSLKRHDNGDIGYRLKTIRLRKILSQGLALPLSLFPELKNVKYKDDVTDILKIQLYEPPENATTKGNGKGKFPSFLIKSEQERIQDNLNYFIDFRFNEFEVTEKLDGTSCTIFHNNGKIGVCSRNREVMDDKSSVYSKVNKNMKITDGLIQYGKNIALQGEIIGVGVQGNKYKIDSYRFFVYNIIDIDNYQFYLPNKRIEIFNEIKKLCPKIEHVPIIEEKEKIFMIIDNIDDLLIESDGISKVYKTKREGLVYKSLDGRCSFKVINNKFLLKTEK